MRIAILHYTLPPVIGGVERVVRDQAAALRKLGHEVECFSDREAFRGWLRSAECECPDPPRDGREEGPASEDARSQRGMADGDIRAPYQRTASKDTRAPYQRVAHWMNYEDSHPYFEPAKDISKHRHGLPHWQQGGKLYFVTWRLGDALPQEKLRELREARERWLEENPKPWTDDEEECFKEHFEARVEEWLDAGMGSCVLQRDDVREALERVLHHADGEVYDLLSYVIMPNHVHVLFRLHAGQALEELMKAWKGASARRIGALVGGKGSYWQEGYRDRMIRGPEHLEFVLGYIQRNPKEAKLKSGTFAWWECGRAVERGCPHPQARLDGEGRPASEDTRAPRGAVANQGRGDLPRLADEDIRAPHRWSASEGTRAPRGAVANQGRGDLPRLADGDIRAPHRWSASEDTRAPQGAVADQGRGDLPRLADEDIRAPHRWSASEDTRAPQGAVKNRGRGDLPRLADEDIRAPQAAVIVHNVFTMPFDLEWTRELTRLAQEHPEVRWMNWVHDVCAVNPAYAHVEWTEPVPQAVHVAVSEVRRADYARATGLALESIRVIPNGLDLAAVLGLTERMADLGVKTRDRDLVLVHPTRLVRRKNIELGLRVVAALHEAGCDAVYAITGAPDPHQADGAAYHRELKALARELGIMERVLFLGEDGALGDADVRSLYAVADALFFPSTGEGFGLPLLEALAHRLPVFCSALPVHHEVLGHAGHYFQIDDDPVKISARIMRWLTDTQPTHHRRFLRERFDMVKICQEHLEPLLLTAIE